MKMAFTTSWNDGDDGDDGYGIRDMALKPARMTRDDTDNH